MPLRESIGNYDIRESASAAYGTRGVIIEIRGIESLPAVLRRLAEMGYDLAPSLNALQGVVEQQGIVCID